MNGIGDLNRIALAKHSMKILITQPRPESDKSPYFELARRYNLELELLSIQRSFLPAATPSIISFACAMK